MNMAVGQCFSTKIFNGEEPVILLQTSKQDLQCPKYAFNASIE